MLKMRISLVMLRSGRLWGLGRFCDLFREIPHLVRNVEGCTDVSQRSCVPIERSEREHWRMLRNLVLFHETPHQVRGVRFCRAGCEVLSCGV